VLSPKLTWDCGKTSISIQSLAFYSILDPPLLTPSPQNTVRVEKFHEKEDFKMLKNRGVVPGPVTLFFPGVKFCQGAKSNAMKPGFLRRGWEYSCETLGLQMGVKRVCIVLKYQL